MTRRTVTDACLQKSLAITKAFEGGGLSSLDTLSWGPLQWNIKAGTLIPILERIHTANPSNFRRIMGENFTSATVNGYLRQYIVNNVSPQVPAWRPAFNELERQSEAQAVFMASAQTYVNLAELACVRLGLETERGFAFMFDVAVQNGGLRIRDHVPNYWPRCTQLWAEEWQRLKLLAQSVAACALPRWHDDVLSRKLTIAVREGRVHGRNYDLYRDFRLDYNLKWYNPA